MKNKIFIVTFLIIILLSTISMASYSTVTMEVVEEPVCTIEIGENSEFEKRLIEKNLNNKEVTLQLQVTNNEEAIKLTGEAMIVIDNSDSMEELVSGSDLTRKDLVLQSANSLVTRLLEDNSNLSIGVVGFSSSTDTSQEGTLQDAFLVSELSNNVDELTNAISNIDANGARTDLDAGLTLANEYFTETQNNKYMIVLTDGVPNIALDYDNVYYSDTVIENTRQTMLDLEDSGIQLYTVLTGITEQEENEPATGVSKTYGEIISEIFGAPEDPTAGRFYYISDDEIEETISNTIYNELLPESVTYTDFTIVDYFPQEIIDNFEFAYVSQASHGNISAEVDDTTNSITWTIPELKAGETATVQYTLKLKENFDSSIVDQILDTNERVDIGYTDNEGTPHELTSDVTPKLRLTEPPAVLPAAGTTILTVFLVIAIGLLIFSFIKWISLKRNF